jgi:hypothetical protein
MEIEVNRVVVFLGPTLSHTEAATYLDALYLPPAEQGSVLRAVIDYAPSTIAIIDGAFARRPAVRHKEILWALSRGIDVLGASSMGALRAAELHPFGMIGVGLIYRWYRATPMADDDDVAVAMAPVEFGSQSISDSMINMRLTFRRAMRLGLIDRRTYQLLCEKARSTYFIERRYETVIDAVRIRMGSSADSQLLRLERFLRMEAIDQKRNDAIELLQYLATGSQQVCTLSAPKFRLTEAWAADLVAAGQWDAFVEVADNLAHNE